MLNVRLTKRPLPPEAQIDRIRQAVTKELAPVGRQHVNQRAAVVAGWQDSHRPEFESDVTVSGNQVTLDVSLKNGDKALGRYGGTIADLWRWINYGTKAHTIVPRFATILRFAVGNTVVFARRVSHPGTRGQKHEEKINSRLQGAVKAAIDRGVRLGLRRK